jgi:arabinogalactan endo-1,4-beta-galactosidase
MKIAYKKMNKAIILILALLIFFSCKEDEKPEWNPPVDPPDTEDSTFFTGMDLSYQPFLENYDFDYKDENGVAINNLLQWVKDNGVNLIRVRLFHTPDPSNAIHSASSLEEVITLCKKIKATGNRIFLDIHYSDKWADPGQQTVPAAWEGLSFELINDSVYAYTKAVLSIMHDKNVFPEIVQIGNETRPGFLWDHGKLWIGDDDDNWPAYTTLVKNALDAISEVENETHMEIKTMIHLDGTDGADNFYQKLKQYKVGYDMIGLSHYHNWHTKDLQELQSVLNQLATNYGKPIMIVETRYPFTLGWNDNTHNPIGSEDDLISGYPATPEGQKDYFMNFVKILKNVPDNKGVGFIWWAPDMVAFDGPESTNGSSMENVSTWDFENKALPVFEVFRQN